MARRGLLAEIQHQVRVAAREAEKRERAAVREHNAAVRRAEQARKANERARAKAARAAEADRKRLEKEAKAAHVAVMEAEVEERNSALAEIYDEIDGLLSATLDVDDYVDLDTLRRTVDHPPFLRTDLETPIPEPIHPPHPPEPLLVLPEPPRVLFGKKKKHAIAIARAEAAYERAYAAWGRELKSLESQRHKAAARHARAEADRKAALKQELIRYEAGCEVREDEVVEHNRNIDSLITNLGYGTVEAVQEYVSIVLSNSVYPVHFPVEHEFTFEPSTAELSVQTVVPPPGEVPEIKAYKYTKKSDEISTTALSMKARKDRYSSAIHQVALRSLHEIFEADRRGLIKTISLVVRTTAVSPATGNVTDVPFVAVAAERDTFIDFDLAVVVPAATLDHLGASVSKNPYGLVAVDVSGVRRS